MDLREFQPADLQAVHQLISRTIDASYSGVYPPRAVRFFKDHHSVEHIMGRHAAGDLVVAEEDGALVATGSLIGDEVAGVFVHPDFQRRGIGARVMDRLEHLARERGLAVVRLDVSLPSRGFYEDRGYRVLEDRSIDVGGDEVLDYWLAERSVGGES